MDRRGHNDGHSTIGNRRGGELWPWRLRVKWTTKMPVEAGAGIGDKINPVLNPN